MTESITSERANRLAIGLAKSRVISYEKAVEILQSLRLRIVLSPGMERQTAAQAALLTALNTAHRAFLGGVEIQISSDVPLRLPLKGVTTLNRALSITGCAPMRFDSSVPTIYIGEASAHADPQDVLVYCDGWRAGVSDVSSPIDFHATETDELALGGIMAGAMAVHRCFMRAAQLPVRLEESGFGISLWDPRVDWRMPIEGIMVRNLPKRFWMLGLGHLGQAFIWSLALLPHPCTREVEFLLHDYDIVDDSNYGSGLLCTQGSVGQKKTRNCALWLEKLGFKTTLVERRFESTDRCREDEPSIAFCGFDNAISRQHIDNANFGMVLECGLGGSLADFDQIDMHVFPSKRHTADKLWGNIEQSLSVNEKLIKLFGGEKQVCGALAIDIAGKSVSTSFVGAMAGALAVAELMRTYNGGPRFDDIVFDARSTENRRFLEATVDFSASRLGAMGYASL